MPGSVFLLAEEKKRCENCLVRVRDNLCVGDASTLASGLTAANPVDIFG